MALFKISKGKSTNLPANKVNGYCYVTTDEHKLYVDYTKDDGTLDRFALNAATADKLQTARTISLTGSITGSGSFDGSGDLSIVTTTNHTHTSLSYSPMLTSDSAIDSFHAANIFQAALWNETNSPGTGNGIILDMGWRNTDFGAQIAIDDDPNYFIALRQRNRDGWESWKRIPMSDGTGASGTWDISINGNAATATSISSATPTLSTGIEYNEITIKSNDNDRYGSHLLSIRSAMDFKWYDTHWQIGNIRGEEFDSRGFGFAYSSDGGSTFTLKSYIDTNGQYIGNAATATKATQDGEGNVISSTYLPLSGGMMTGTLTFNNNIGILGGMAGNDNWQLKGSGVDDMGVLQLIIGDNATSDYFDIIFRDWSETEIKAIRFGGSSIHSYVPLYGAVWNDYAEFRICKDDFKPGQVVCENNDDILNISTYRLQPGANIVSDTYGFAIGETDDAKCPIAVSGRVLAYTYEPREEFNAGDAVCAGPNGTVSKMTREEIREYPERIIGTVSAVPDYEIWGSGNVEVNGRIWIKVI